MGRAFLALRPGEYFQVVTMSDLQSTKPALSSSRHIIPVSSDGPEVDTDDFLEELESYQEQFENDHFEALQSGEYITGYDPLESSLVEVLVRFTSLSMVQLPNSVRYAITQLSLLFEQILTSHDLSVEIRKLLGFIQVPLLRMAIMDEKFIENANNTAIRLFYKLSDTAALWVPSGNVHTDKLYQQLATLIKELRDQELLTYEFCESKLSELVELFGGDLSADEEQHEQVVEVASEEVAEGVVEELEPRDPLRELVESINVGVRLDYFNGEDTQKLKVAAVLPTSGEIVLVTRAQEKFGSFDRDDIYDALQEGTMILDEDSLHFNKTLESVIGNLRK